MHDTAYNTVLLGHNILHMSHTNITVWTTLETVSGGTFNWVSYLSEKSLESWKVTEHRISSCSNMRVSDRRDAEGSEESQI
jgi:hypothetical protein